MIKTIKINSGSFDVATVLSYSLSEFIDHYNKLLPRWLNENQRVATLNEVYKIALDIKNRQNDDKGISDETGYSEYRSYSEDGNWGNKGTNYREESGSNVTRYQI